MDTLTASDIIPAAKLLDRNGFEPLGNGLWGRLAGKAIAYIKEPGELGGPATAWSYVPALLQFQGPRFLCEAPGNPTRAVQVVLEALDEELLYVAQSGVSLTSAAPVERELQA